MRGPLLVLLFWLGLTAPACAGDDPVLAAATVAFQRSGVPGMALALAGSEGPPAVTVWGVRRQGEPAPIASDDPFHLASMTKPMTASMIGVLVDEGVLDWRMTPADIWPGARLDPVLARVTLAQLLSHRAGLAPYTDLAQIAAAPRFAGDGRAQRAAFARWLLARRPAFRDHRAHYGNANFAVAAAMAETVTGRSWEDLMRTRLFVPLSLTTCGFGWPAARSPAWPTGHRYRNGRFVPQAPGDPYAIAPFLAPAEDVSCSAGDVARFGQAWLAMLGGHRGFLTPATVQAMTRDDIGWAHSAGSLSHLGGAGTFHGAVFVIPFQNRVVVVLANAGEGRTALVREVVLAAVR